MIFIDTKERSGTVEFYKAQLSRREEKRKKALGALTLCLKRQAQNLIKKEDKGSAGLTLLKTHSSAGKAQAIRKASGCGRMRSKTTRRENTFTKRK